jgi:ATP-dependent RNA helicase RhlE
LHPTRELAYQITKSLRDYGSEMEYLSIATIYGGVSIKQQINQLVRGNEIVVATPGRLIDLIERGSISLGKIEVLILDEADQMMDMGFIHALKKIIPLIPKNRQTLFFSATMLPKIKKLAEQFLNNPVTVSVTPP